MFIKPFRYPQMLDKTDLDFPPGFATLFIQTHVFYFIICMAFILQH